MSDAAAASGSRTRAIWFVAALFVALTVVMAYPLSVRPASTLQSADPDTELFIWTLAWDAHAFLHQPLAIFNANIYYPERRTLAYSENLIGSAFIAAPILWLTSNPVLALNSVMLLSVVLCGLGAYVLGRRLGMGHAAAIVCGLIFAFSPARFLRIYQVHQVAYGDQMAAQSLSNDMISQLVEKVDEARFGSQSRGFSHG